MTDETNSTKELDEAKKNTVNKVQDKIVNSFSFIKIFCKLFRIKIDIKSDNFNICSFILRVYLLFNCLFFKSISY